MSDRVPNFYVGMKRSFLLKFTFSSGSSTLIWNVRLVWQVANERYFIEKSRKSKHIHHFAILVVAILFFLLLNFEVHNLWPEVSIPPCFRIQWRWSEHYGGTKDKQKLFCVIEDTTYYWKIPHTGDKESFSWWKSFATSFDLPSPFRDTMVHSGPHN